MNTFTVSPIFSTGMVIQRDTPMTIWGAAPSGSLIDICFAEQKLAAYARNNLWRAQLPPVPAGGPYRLTLGCNDESIIIEDILAGEVWIAGGQSNMEWPLKNAAGGRLAIDAANYPQIRCYNVQKLLYVGETDDNPEKFILSSAWRPATPDNVGDFSAVAYHFALDLHEKLGVPVGIISCNLGGSSASAWTSRDYLRRDADVHSYVDEYEASARQIDMEDYIAKTTQAARMMAQAPMPLDPEHENESFMDLSNMPAHFQRILQTVLQPGPRSPFGHPGSLFCNMVMTIVPYTAKGVIFYQGESDDVKARLYARLFSLLIQNWRDSFENQDLWFLFVQLAAYGREGNPGGETYALLREQQAIVAQTVPRTAVAAALDLGHYFDIHPRRKAPVGQRLARLARNKIYGEPIESSGPVYRSMAIDGNKIILHFDHAESGLICPDNKLKGFRVAGANRLYFDAEATIDGNTVIVSSPDVPMPAAASYGWANYVEVNLYNGDGLPAFPFKTDKYL